MKKIKILLVVILSIVLSACGFKPIHQKGYNQIYIKKINITGDQRISSIFKNNLLMISNANSENEFDIEIVITRNKVTKDKDKAGKIKRYTLNLHSTVQLINQNNDEKIEKNFSNSQDFDIGEIHSDTINNEKNATKNISQSMTNDVINFIKMTMSIK